MRRIKLGLATLILAALPFGLASTAAEAKVLDCKVTPIQNEGWLTDRYVFSIDEAKGTVMVDDGLIEYFNKGPIAGKLVENSDIRIAVTWELMTSNQSGQRSKMTFRGTYFVKLNQFQLTMKPMGYRDVYDANGTCVIS